jgi:hypothetical protein
MTPDNPAAQYFATINAALDGLDIYLNSARSPLLTDGMMGKIALPYLERLKASFACWENRLGFMETFRISRAESGYPVFQNVLELENDRQTSEHRLAYIPAANDLRAEMADFILRTKSFPTDLQSRMAERLYLEHVQKGDIFSPFILPETMHVDVNAKTGRPVYVVTWGVFDGSQSLPMVYLVQIEDSSEKLIDMLVGSDGRLSKDVEIPLPVGGLLNPELARQFDDFASKNSSYALTPATIAVNMDKDFEDLHPKLLRRIIMGPFYSAGITENNEKVNEILSKVRKTENAWLLTWTVQEIFSKNEIPAKRGIFSSTPAQQEFHINTDNLEAARQGVSAYEKHALVPHDAYQALFAEGAADTIFADYKVHVISSSQVITEV